MSQTDLTPNTTQLPFFLSTSNSNMIKVTRLLVERWWYTKNGSSLDLMKQIVENRSQESLATAVLHLHRHLYTPVK